MYIFYVLNLFITIDYIIFLTKILTIWLKRPCSRKSSEKSSKIKKFYLLNLKYLTSKIIISKERL